MTVNKVLIIDVSGTLKFVTALCLCLSFRYEVHLLLSPKEEKKLPSHIRSLVRLHRQDADIDGNCTENWLQVIEALVVSESIDLLLPADNQAIEFAIANRLRLSVMATLTPLPALNDYKIANNKLKLANLLESHRLPCPDTWTVDKTDIHDLPNDLAFPLLLKVAGGTGGGHGITRFNNEYQLKNYFDRMTKTDVDMILQFYVESVDICISVLCDRGNIIIHTIQRSWIRNQTDYAPALAVEFVHHQVVFDIATRMMRELCWSGVAHIDMILEEATGNVLVLEINPRFWDSLKASLVAGVNFPEQLCDMAFDKAIRYQGYKKIQYIGLGDLVALIRNKIDKPRTPVSLTRLRTGVFLRFNLLWRRFLQMFAGRGRRRNS